MPAIGHVTKSEDGNFKGQLKTLSFRAPIDILLNPSKSGDTQPDYRVYSQAVEIGAGWIKKGKPSAGRASAFRDGLKSAPKTGKAATKYAAAAHHR
jgi:uncharacterized protein (DUF736 family)